MEKKKISKVYIGYDLGREDCQISLYSKETGSEPISIATCLGGDRIRIPLTLAKRTGIEQWYYGEEAIRKAEQEEAVLVENIYEKALQKETIILDEKEYQGELLFQMYIKKTLGLLLSYIPLEKIDSCTFCVEKMEKETVEMWKNLMETLPIKKEALYAISYSEAFAYYMAYQDQSLWERGVLLLEYDKNLLKGRILTTDKNTLPHLMKVEEVETVEMEPDDQLFMNYVKQIVSGHLVSSVYLVGDGFKEQWYQETLKLLCQGRRAFRGQNLYGLGALNYSGIKLGVKEQNCLYLGPDQIKVNFLLKAVYQGEEADYEILSADLHWYEAETEIEFILDGKNEVAVYIRSLDGKCEEIIRTILKDFPVREEKASRLKMNIYFQDKGTGIIQITDMGFGEVYESSGRVWKEEFGLQILEEKLNGNLKKI
ncbi:MAG: hypothetical protein IJA36_06890 [Lachnospiraceae bacterium]|nr:hypothetical protein [Lachnospiraceae bacterium]